MIAWTLIAIVALLLCAAVFILDSDREHLAQLVREERAENARLRARLLMPGDTPVADVAWLDVFGPQDPEGGAA